MSIHAITEVWRNSTSKGSTLLLLLAIADFADEHGRAFPSIETLSRKIRMSDRNTIRLIECAEEQNEIVIERAPNKVNQYRLTPNGVDITPHQSNQPAQPKPAKPAQQGDNLSPQKNFGSDKLSPHSDKSLSKMSPEPSISVKEPFLDDDDDELRGDFFQILNKYGVKDPVQSRISKQLAVRFSHIGLIKNLCEEAASEWVESLNRSKPIENPAGLIISRIATLIKDVPIKEKYVIQLQGVK